MIKKTSLLLVLMIGVCQGLRAEETAQVLSFVRSYVEGMETITPALKDVYQFIDGHDVWQIWNENKKPLTVEDMPLLSKSLESLNAVLKAVVSKIESYTESPDEDIRAAAERTRHSYQQLIQDNETGIGLLESFAETGGTKEEYEKMMYEISDGFGSLNSSLIHDSYEVEALIRKTYPVPAKDYPAKERADILNRLQIIFGEDAKDPSFYEGYHFQNCAVPIYEALTK